MRISGKSILKPRTLEILEIITVGFPFCSFKYLSGLLLIQQKAMIPLGVFLLSIGTLDFILNAIHFFSLIFTNKRKTPICILSFIFKRIKYHNYQLENVGIALDVAFSFLIVALMIAFTGISRLQPNEIILWNASVVFNVIGAGMSRLAFSVSEIVEKILKR